jgi:hypothetical protein
VQCADATMHARRRGAEASGAQAQRRAPSLREEPTRHVDAR